MEALRLRYGDARMSTNDRRATETGSNVSLPVEDLSAAAVDPQTAEQVKGGTVIRGPSMPTGPSVPPNSGTGATSSAG